MGPILYITILKKIFTKVICFGAKRLKGLQSIGNKNAWKLFKFFSNVMIEVDSGRNSI